MEGWYRLCGNKFHHLVAFCQKWRVVRASLHRETETKCAGRLVL